MAKDTLEILDGSGHIEITWDPANEQEVAHARAEVAHLKAAGYQFFAVENEPADEVAAGRGSLIVQRIEDPLERPAPLAVVAASEGEQAASEQPTGRGRRTVATRPMRGGADEGPVTAAELAASAPDPGDDFEGCVMAIADSVAARIITERSLPELERARRFLARAGRRYIDAIERTEAGGFWPQILIEQNRELMGKLAREYVRLLDGEGEA